MDFDTFRTNYCKKYASQKCTIKILQPLFRVAKSRTYLKDVKKRFWLESYLLKNLKHPNLCRAIDSGFLEYLPNKKLDSVDINTSLACWIGAPFFAMRHIKAQNLCSLLCNEMPLISHRIKWIIELGKVIQYLHSNGILHRDLKLENILISKHDLRIILTDLGTVKNCNSRLLHIIKDTMDDPYILTTWQYLPPEVEFGNQQYSSSSEIWSLGKVFLEIVKWQAINKCEILSNPSHIISLDSQFLEQTIKSMLHSMPLRRTSIEAINSNLKNFATLDLKSYRNSKTTI